MNGCYHFCGHWLAEWLLPFLGFCACPAGGYEEAGATLDMPVGTVKSHIHRLRQRSVENEAALYHAMHAGAAGACCARPARRNCSEPSGMWPRVIATFSPAAAQKLAGRAAHAELTERELEILRHVANGKSNKEIGALLFLAEDTERWFLSS